MTPATALATLSLGTCAAAPGRLTRGQLELGRLPSGQPVLAPVVMLTGTTPGPVVLITAALHGDELAGVATLQRCLETLNPATLAGGLIALPLVNPTGYRLNQRTVPECGSDLNRSFPGRRDGLLAEQIAATLFSQVLPRVDF
ncbi:MAG: succinylglutamate desuccinylase/aspartoacylase family protein, partial [bacterium]